jgi:glucose/mannose transport system permease protein
MTRPLTASLPHAGLSVAPAAPVTTRRLRLHRLALWAALGLFAAWFLAPLYVMLVTSLKDMEQIRAGSLLSLPTSPSLEAWSRAWSSACTGTDCCGPSSSTRCCWWCRRC